MVNGIVMVNIVMVNSKCDGKCPCDTPSSTVSRQARKQSHFASRRLCPSTAGRSPPSKPATAAYIMPSCSTWFPPLIKEAKWQTNKQRNNNRLVLLLKAHDRFLLDIFTPVIPFDFSTSSLLSFPFRFFTYPPVPFPLVLSRYTPVIPFYLFFQPIQSSYSLRVNNPFWSSVNPVPRLSVTLLNSQRLSRLKQIKEQASK